MMPLASVIVLVCNKAGYTARCLGGLAKTQWRPLEVIVIDNGSTDETPELLDDFERRAGEFDIAVKRGRNETNAGAVTGRNQALEIAEGELIAFMDNDVAVRSRAWIETLAGALDGTERGGIAGPKLIYPFPPHLIQCAGAAVSRRGRVFFLGRGERRDAAEFDRPAEVQCLISACWLMRRAVYEEVGPLEEGYNPVQFEDIDYCYAARERGWKVLYEPGAELYHFENVTTSGTPAINSPYQIVRNGLLFQRRWRHMFAVEHGPREEAWRWPEIPTVRLDSIGELETA